MAIRLRRTLTKVYTYDTADYVGRVFRKISPEDVVEVTGALRPFEFTIAPGDKAQWVETFDSATSRVVWHHPDIAKIWDLNRDLVLKYMKSFAILDIDITSDSNTLLRLKGYVGYKELPDNLLFTNKYLAVDYFGYGQMWTYKTEYVTLDRNSKVGWELYNLGNETVTVIVAPYGVAFLSRDIMKYIQK